LKIKHWQRKFAASLLAAGLLLPATSYALNIPLADPSFEDFVVSAIGYAYSNEYRPTSAWVDDLDSPFGHFQDDGASQWLYDAAYAEHNSSNRRASPRTGNQAIHGLGNYSVQETTALFEAGRTYTFSVWAQNDVLFDDLNGVFLYIFDASVHFSDPDSLSNAEVTAINQRTAGMTAAESAANWTQISISHTVAPEAPEIGHPIGVAFFARSDSAVDDATLTVAPPAADFDGDDDVDGADFLLWQRGLGQNVLDVFTGGLGDGDFVVDEGDLEIWAAQFGSAGSISVPEPGTLAWTALAAALALRRPTPAMAGAT
jgi:hypothetical protein